MNRAARRRLRRQAVELADQYVAGGIVVAGLSGGAARITSGAALRVVHQELVAVLRAGGEPRVRRLTEIEARGFPFTDHVDGADPWLAVGLDRDGRAALVTRWVARGAGAAGEVALWAELAEQLVASGLPMPRVMAGCA